MGSGPPSRLDDRCLAAAVAHEVRRVLTPARAYAELALAEPGLPYHASRALSAILTASAATQSVIDCLLGLDPAPQSAGILAAIHATPGVTHPVAVDFQVALSPASLEILFANLIGNARRAAGPAGTVDVRARSTGNSRIIVDIVDDGGGMTPKQIRSATEPFTSFSGGSGMGLAICRYIVESAGGSLRIASAPGRGTCVSVELPQALPNSLKKTA